MSKKQKTKMTRKAAENLWVALMVLGQLKITTRMRYHLSLCRSALQPVHEAIETAAIEPDLSAYRTAADALDRQTQDPEFVGGDAEVVRLRAKLREEHKEALEAHDRWATERASFMAEEVEVDIVTIPLECEIDDSVHFPNEGPERSRQNQLLIEGLMPVLVVP